MIEIILVSIMLGYLKFINMRSTISYLNREKIDTKQAEVKNLIGSNIEFDVEIKCIEKRTTQVIIAEDIDTTKSYIICIINKQDGVLN